jgi:3,4-dihydroxy 2-butanone 4-phosphate synthase / GTP cyclohydrolase II
MDTIAQEGRGILIYEHQEGRGIGLVAKLQAYALQDRGLDTIEANHALGFAGDCRDYALPAAILHDLGVRRIRLLSNNPTKHLALAASGIEVVERVPCEIAPSPQMQSYMQVKKIRMGHTLSML